jgi:uncharacterized Zn-finger protein
MDATPPANVVETVRQEATVRACPGCSARIDLGEYGLLVCATAVVCPGCSTTYRLSELIRV